jgi:diguanylate cyclase (GGDEF)-like protein
MDASRTTLRVLILEDRAADAELAVDALSRAGYAPEWRRVDSESAFMAALADVPQLILADYSLLNFTGLEAVRLLRSRGHDVPCIVVSGTIGEELAVECLKAGADDYLLKDRLARLGHAVKRALGEHEQRKFQRAAEAELAHQALYDPLTDLPNRSLLRTRLHQALQAQLAGAPRLALLALLALDLDHFKEINDTLGYQVGDVLLQQIGKRLQEVVSGDVVACVGGDKFAVMLSGTDAARATQVAETLVRALQMPFVLDGQPIAVDVSIGIALAPEHGVDADKLLGCADIAMNRAKRSGAGPVVFHPDQDRRRPERLALLGELRGAIDQGQLLLHYQPKLDMRDGSLVGVEALVRWQHPQRGFLPPSEFIPLAEQTGLIYPLSNWVLEAALKQHHVWPKEGIEVPVAVNLSRRTLHDPQLPETVAQALTRWDVAPATLVLEITESSLMADPTRAGQNLTHLRALGVRLSIDDFGTGYSSLASLKNLPVDELKIDRSFVQAMATDARSRAIVRAIIDLADALKLQVVAEGVEDRTTWDVLAGLGCDVAQGYFLSPPLAAAELDAWCAEMGAAWAGSAACAMPEDPLQERIRGRGARLTAEEEFIGRKQAEAALLASEERNRLALQAAHMGTWDADPVHGTIGWSTETEALHGLAPGMFEGTHEALKRAIDPRDWPAFEHEMMASSAERRETLSEYRTVWPDDSVHWIENKGRGQYATDGTPLRVSGTSMDITGRKLAEEAQRASEERFRKQYKGVPLPTYSWLKVGDDFVMQDYNDAAEALAEGGVREWIGSVASERYVNEPEILADLHTCVLERRTIRHELRFRYPVSGRERDLALSYVFVPPATVMLHNDDITERKQAEQQREALAQSDKLRALGQMASGIAHDLNQSLMLVASYGALAHRALVQTPPDLPAAEDSLTTAIQAAMDGGETVKRLLLFTRKAPEQDRQPVDFSNLVRDSALLTAPHWRDAAQAEGRPITLLVEATAHPIVQGSPSQLRELMTNLIFNAVDALPVGGTIRLRVMIEDGNGIVEVVDTGVGMSAEVQERVFEPFFTTKGHRGTGLGLAMVFAIVERHDGHIQVHSAPGEGTTFRITLPLIEKPAERSDASTPAPGSAVALQVKPTRPLRVLVVDDEPMMTRAVVRMLRPARHLVREAASGEEALLLLAGETFDVVVSDMAMGAGMNGWDLAQAVMDTWPHVQFLLATGWGAAIDPGEARGRGVDAVLSKPYRPEDLERALALIMPA